MQTCIPLAYVVHHAPCVHTWAPNLAMATQDPSQVVAPPKPTLGPQTPSSSCALDRGVPPPSSKATKRAKHRPSRAKPRWQWPEMGANESTTRSDPLPRVARVATMGHTNDTDWASARFTRAFEHLRRLQGSPQEPPPPPRGTLNGSHTDPTQVPHRTGNGFPDITLDRLDCIKRTFRGCSMPCLPLHRSKQCENLWHQKGVETGIQKLVSTIAPDHLAPAVSAWIRPSPIRERVCAPNVHINIGTITYGETGFVGSCPPPPSQNHPSHLPGV